MQHDMPFALRTKALGSQAGAADEGESLPAGMTPSSILLFFSGRFLSFVLHRSALAVATLTSASLLLWIRLRFAFCDRLGLTSDAPFGLPHSSSAFPLPSSFFSLTDGMQDNPAYIPGGPHGTVLEHAGPLSRTSRRRQWGGGGDFWSGCCERKEFLFHMTPSSFLFLFFSSSSRPACCSVIYSYRRL